MKRKIGKKVLASLLAVTMCFSLNACGSGQGGEGEMQGSEVQNDTAANAVTTLQMFSLPSNTSGVQENYYWTDILEKDLGIQLEMLPSGDQGKQKLQTLMSSGELPDIVIFNDVKQVTNAIEANMLLNLDEHKDKLPNAYKNVPSAIEYVRDNFSNDTGVCYALPSEVTTTSATSGQLGYGPYLRWDLYKEMGMPPVKNMEDYLPLLKKMIEKSPKNEDGQNIYGLSVFSDWDLLIPYHSRYFMEMYGMRDMGFSEVNMQDSSFKSIFDSDSMYKRSLQFLFDANQMGILDPDSMTQRYDDYVNKATAGRVLFSYWPWGAGSFDTPEKAAQNIGFKPVFFEHEKQYSTAAPNHIGSGEYFAISAKTKNLDKALEFVDYMYSVEGLWRLYFGEQGVAWDLDENGKTYLTEQGWDMVKNQKEFPNGGKLGDGFWIMNSYGLTTRAIHPEYNTNMNYLSWEKKDFAPQDTVLEKDWKETMDAKDDVDYVYKNNLYVEAPFAPMPAEPNEIEQINARIGDMVKTISWQMIFAKDQANFESLWNSMAEQAKGMNVETTDQWYQETYQKSLAQGQKYMAK